MTLFQQPSTPPAPIPVTQEEVLWQGGPSQAMGFRWHALTLFLVVLLIAGKIFIPAFPWGWMIAGIALAFIPTLVVGFRLMCIRYILTTERLTSMQGIFLRRVDELELYRVKDTYVLEPLDLRLIGRGHVILKTSDQTNPELKMIAIAQPQEVQRLIRQYAEKIREAKGVHSVNLE